MIKVNFESVSVWRKPLLWSAQHDFEKVIGVYVHNLKKKVSIKLSIDQD